MHYRIERSEKAITFSPTDAKARVLMTPFATTAELIEEVLDLKENQHHSWGVKELLNASVEVTVARRYAERYEKVGQDWLLPDTRDYDLIYSNHNRLVKTSIASMVGLNKTPFVSLVYAGEALIAPRRHFGILGMTPTACQRFEGLDGVDVRYAPWGIDPSSAVHEQLTPTRDHFVSTGVTERDFQCLRQAARSSELPIVISARGADIADMPSNVRVNKTMLSPWGVRDLYKGAAAGLVTLEPDENKRMAVGWTNILEMMVVGLPIIKTRTGALDDIVDLEKIGAGILIPPRDPDALVAAMRRLWEDKDLRLEMGKKGAAYARTHLTMDRFAEPLIDLVLKARDLKS